MKYNMKIEHLPSGRTWLGDSSSLSPEELTDAQNFCVSIVEGKVAYLKLSPGNTTAYFNEGILKDCVVYLVKESL